MLILKESDLSGYFYRAVQIQGQASKPHIGQQLRFFLRRHDLRQIGDGAIRYADDRRVFLRPYLVGGCRGIAATQLASWLWDKVSGWISSIWDGICDFFGIHSPSKEMAWVGEMLVKGLAGSIDDNGDEAVKAAEGMAEDINGVMGNLAHDMQTALPTDFDVNGSIRTAVDGLTGKAASVFTIALNIATFNNYSSEDIRQLTNEVMETANQFAQRKGVVFA